MLCKRGGVNPALPYIFSVALVLPMASQALASIAYRCEFTKECQTGQPCNDNEPQMMMFSPDSEDANTWSLTPADGQGYSFTKLPFETEDLSAFVSTSIDPGASAVSLLTVFADGQAIMGIQGVFYSPGSVTHLGTCVPKDS